MHSPNKIYQDWPLRLKYRDQNVISRVKRTQADQGGICCKHVQMSTARRHDPVDVTKYGWGGGGALKGLPFYQTKADVLILK